MKSIGFVLVQMIRFLAVPVGIWQVLGLLPVFTWLDQLDAVTAGMWMMLIVKGTILVLCFAFFFGLRSVANRLRPATPEAASSSD